ncbi:MAG: MASE1 domain-containing protein [Acidimicrobiia bacterium]
MGADVTQSVRPAGRSWTPPAAAGALGSLVVFGLAYAGAARAGAELAAVSGVSAVWPAAGVAVAGLLILGTWAWPAVMVASYLETITHAISAPVAFGAATGQTLAALVAVALLRQARFDRALSRLDDVLALVFLGAFASSLVAAAIGPTAFAAGGHFSRDDFPFAWFDWWIGDAVGVLTVTPLLLLFGRLRADIPPGRVPEAIGLLAVTAVGTILVFRSPLPVMFLVFPFVLWAALRLGLPGAVGVSVVVTAVAVGSTVEGYGPFSRLPTHSRMVSFQLFNASVVVTALLVAAVVNERRRALHEVRDSRARIVEAADTERRRLERDLHDGAQQRLVSLSGTLGLTIASLGEGQGELSRALSRALGDAQAAQSELRSLARGIHPAVLTDAGLAGAIEALAEQCPVPVETRVSARRYPAVVEATVYFIVCEALTNMAKHARASSGRVHVQEHNGRLLVEVVDDGVGGADHDAGSGLVGLADRTAAVGGRLRIDSPSGGGTRLTAELPCD